MAFVAYAAILTLIGAGDYMTDYFDPIDLGPLVLSLIGIVATLIAFVVLQRYLAKRLPPGAFARASARSAATRCGATHTARDAAGT